MENFFKNFGAEICHQIFDLYQEYIILEEVLREIFVEFGILTLYTYLLYLPFYTYPFMLTYRWNLLFIIFSTFYLNLVIKINILYLPLLTFYPYLFVRCYCWDLQKKEYKMLIKEITYEKINLYIKYIFNFYLKCFLIFPKQGKYSK